MFENNNIKMGIRDGMPIGIGYFALSFTIGVFASSLGFSPAEAFLISLLNFTSAGQIAAMPAIAAYGSLFEIALTQFIINSRYALMSVSLSQRFGESITLKDKLLLAFFNTDEIFAVSYSKNTPIGKKYFLALGIIPHVGWSFGTLIGAALGNLLPDYIADALSVALYAMLITIITQASKASRSTCVCVIFAILTSLAFAYLPLLKELPDGITVVIITVLLSTIFSLVAPIKDDDMSKEADAV